MRIISGDARGIGASAACALLKGLSGVYLAGLKTRELARDLGVMRQYRVDARVVSIGNVTTGGTGKTPATIHFARTFLEEGHNTVVLSRGYGRMTPINEPLAVSDREKILLSPRESGDEPFLIARKVAGAPVVVCGKRVKGADFAIDRFGAEIIVLDDGFQHTAIARDEDIVVIDCFNPFGYGHLLPRGLLREPLSALKRATSFLLTHADECDHRQISDTLQRINPVAPVIRSRHRPVRFVSVEGNEGVSCDVVAGKRILAVSSIGNPVAFEKTLEKLGAHIVQTLRFKDHHWYGVADIEEIEYVAERAEAEHIISTEKDGIRLSCVPKRPLDILLLEVELQLLS